MITTLRNPACGLIADELKARDLTQITASKAMGVDKQLLNGLVNYRRDLSTEMAMRVEPYLGISADLLLKVQATYKLRKARQEQADIIEAEVQPLAV